MTDRADPIPREAPALDPADERDHEERRPARCRAARQREVDLAEKSGRRCTYGDAYVERRWPFDRP